MRVFVVLCCVMCSATLSSFERLDDYLDYAVDKTEKLGREMAQTYGLRLVGSGYGDRDFLEHLKLKFTSAQELSVAEVRRLYVTLVEHFLSEINGDRQLRPYFSSFPLTEHGAVGLSFLNPDPNSEKYYVDQEFVAFVTSFHGIVYYDGFDSETKEFVLLHEEPFEDAVRIVREEEAK